MSLARRNRKLPARAGYPAGLRTPWAMSDSLSDAISVLSVQAAAKFLGEGGLTLVRRHLGGRLARTVARVLP
jgi:hypothetical protein